MTTTTLAPSKPKRVHTEEQRLKINESARRRNAKSPRVFTEAEKTANAARHRRYYADNKDHVKATVSAWQRANPDKVRGYTLKSAYGITVEQWDEMFAAQGGSCAICSSPDPKTSKGWHTDHCHETGTVRGILCHPCNIMLGGACDNQTTLSKAIKYLGK